MIDKDLLKNLNTEQKQALLEQLMSNLSQSSDKTEEATEEKEAPTKSGVNQDFTVTRDKNDEKRRTEVKTRKKQGKDNEEIRKDIVTPEGKRTPRERKKQPKTEVECHVCGREFKVESNLIFGEYHRCNRCGGK